MPQNDINNILGDLSQALKNYNANAPTNVSQYDSILSSVLNNLRDSRSQSKLNEIKHLIQLNIGDFAGGVSSQLIKQVLPKILLGYSTVGILGYGIAYIYAKAIDALAKPVLAIEEVRRDGWFSRFQSHPISSATPIFNKEIQEKVDHITKALPFIEKNKGYFQNVLLFGPGGTGKTMISQKIARDSNFNYIMMSGGDLAQYIKRGEHVTQLNKLFERINSSSKPTILFIDEFESLGKDRSNVTSSELLELQNAFLNHTGTQSKKSMIIAATNRASDLDPAVLTRFDYKIFVGPPAIEERIRIITSYLPQFFTPKEIAQFFDKASVTKIAEKIDGLTGRTIFKMLNAIYCQKASTAQNQVSLTLIDQTVHSFVEQEKQLQDEKIAQAVVIS